MKIFFITATGTDIGKTYVTTSLCFQLITQGYKVRAIKPIISGWSDEDNDTFRIIRSLGEEVNQTTIHNTSPWRFSAPLSPDMAAFRENRTILFAELVEFCCNPQLNQACDFLLIEGAGGVMTPAGISHTQLDLCRATLAQAIVITGSYVGSISHCLSACAMLDEPVIIVNESVASSVTVAETCNALRRFTPHPILSLPRASQTDWKYAPDLLSFLIN
jgi:dethiobiotin synthetase